jgi:hypothetical protein
MDEAKIPRIVGEPDGWTPVTELEHQMRCPVCGKWFNMQRLDQALDHWHDGPHGIPQRNRSNLSKV